MSFGNRSSYASLQDAFGISQFSTPENPREFLIEQKNEISETQPMAVESFTEDQVSCETVKNHCQTCNCMKKSMAMTSWINEILNMLLIGLLLWVLVYRPNV